MRSLLIRHTKGNCKLCGADAHTCKGENEVPNAGEHGVVFIGFGSENRGSRHSGVFAPERIVENGRQLYMKGQEMRPADVERLGFGAKPAKPIVAPAKPKPTAEKTPDVAPRRGARGARRKSAAA